jgi:hypothetical protein
VFIFHNSLYYFLSCTCAMCALVHSRLPALEERVLVCYGLFSLFRQSKTTYILISIDTIYIYIYIYKMVLMDSFSRTIFYPITKILSSLSINYIPSCLDSRVDMVSNLDPVHIIFALSLQ